MIKKLLSIFALIVIYFSNIGAKKFFKRFSDEERGVVIIYFDQSPNIGFESYRLEKDKNGKVTGTYKNSSTDVVSLSNPEKEFERLEKLWLQEQAQNDSN